jgi:hypothetical protein
MVFCFPRLFPANFPYQCNPSLYTTCSWEDRTIRKLIGDGKIAARLTGSEYPTIANATDQECPICFLYYTEVNVTQCCNAHLCTECYLQVRPQKEKQPSCPFCNSSKFLVTVAQKPSDEEIQARQKDEQTFIEARIRAERGGGVTTLDDTTPVKKRSGASVAPDSPSVSGFGSELEKDERFQLLKKRSESFSSNEKTRTPQKEAEIIQSIAMTPEERRRLEEEMRAQHNHPLSLRIEAEAQERRLRNEQAYHRSNSDGSNVLRTQRAADLFRSSSGSGAAAARRLRYRGGGRDWNQIVDSFERGGNGEVNSLDDLVVLEAAILLSMEEEARREGDADQFDAARHAAAGFPLVRSLLGGTNSNSRNAEGGELDDTGTSPTAGTMEYASSLSPAEIAEMRRRRRQRVSRAAGVSSSARSRGMMGDAALDTVSMMMRGISEEEQIAMAIAASLQEQNNAASNETENAIDDDISGGSASSSDDGHSSSSEESSSSPLEDGELSSENTHEQLLAGSSTTSTTVPQETAPQEIGDEATTITELASVVTDNGDGGEGTGIVTHSVAD